MTAVAAGRTVVATAGTPVHLARILSQPTSVVITAEEGNTGVIVFGGAEDLVATEATRTGAHLKAEDALTITFDGPSDLADIYIDSDVSGDGVTYTAFGP